MFLNLTNWSQEECRRLVLACHIAQIIMDFLNMHKIEISYNAELSAVRQVQNDCLHFPLYLICEVIKLQLYLQR